MSQVAKIFTNGRSQAVRLPAMYRFEGKEVFIRQDLETGDVILSHKPTNWNHFFSVLSALQQADIPEDFLMDRTLTQTMPNRDPFDGWCE
jgi:antitoxin VapB